MLKESYPAIDPENKQELLSILKSRKPEMTASQLARLKKIIKNLITPLTGFIGTFLKKRFIDNSNIKVLFGGGFSDDCKEF